MNGNKPSISFLIIICSITALLVIPTIRNNVDSPNMIVYFSADEGYLMDRIWSYFCGEKRDSYQMDIDYGLEMVYAADISRLVLSKFMRFSPGTFVLLLRWLHLISWISVLIVVWFLVARHFGRSWQCYAAVLLLSVRPAFAYFSNNLKPEPLMLLFMVIGLYYTLKIVEKPSLPYLLTAVACAAAALIVKFAGIFLLPAIVFALFFGHKYSGTTPKGFLKKFYDIKASWSFPAILSAPFIIAPLLAIFFYVRKSTGFTYYQELGLVQSIVRHKVIFFFWFFGAFLVSLSFFLFLCNKSRNVSLKRFMKKINEINSNALLVILLFALSTLALGFRWIFMPRHLLDVYVFNVMDFSGGEVLRTIASFPDFLHTLLRSIFDKIAAFDVIVFLLFVVYAVTEFINRNRSARSDILRYYKRLTLVIFLLPFFLSLLTIGRLAQHNMLPFFVPASILALQGADILLSSRRGKGVYKKLFIVMISSLLIIDISIYAHDVVKKRMRQFRQHEDIAFEIAKWWRENIPKDSRIVSDHYIFVYIPEEYKNVRVFKRYEKNGIEQFHRLVKEFHPLYVYYNENPGDVARLPLIKEILPEKRIRLIKAFKSSKDRYQRWPNSRFVIYKILD